jgi:hypothetical protein
MAGNRVRSFEFQAPAPLLSMNQAATRARRGYHQAWRDAAYLHYRNTFSYSLKLPPCDVRISLPVTTRVRRDAANFQATVKPIVDGIQRAGAWPDDTEEFCTQHNPTFHYVGRELKLVMIELVER